MVKRAFLRILLSILTVASVCALIPLPANAQGLEITSLDPEQGYQGDQIQVAVFGMLFTPTSDISFTNLDIDVLDVTFVSTDQLQVEISIGDQATLGYCDVKVAEPTGSNFTLKNGFRVLDQFIPQLFSIDPGSALQGEIGFVATLNGDEMLQGGNFSFSPDGGPDLVSATYISPTAYQLVIDIPDDALPGLYDFGTTFPDFPNALILPQAFEVIEVPAEYDLYLEDGVNLSGQGNDSPQADFTFGFTSNKPDIVYSPFYLYASTAVDPVSGESIGQSYIDIAPTVSQGIPPGFYEPGLIRVVIPEGLPSGDYEGDITLSVPGLGMQTSVPFTISVLPSPAEVLYPKLSRQELEVNLVWPGGTDDAKPEEIMEDTPLFEWVSSARYFDFQLYDISASDQAVGAIEYLEPIYVERDIADTRLFYPLGAEPLQPGHSYAWYVVAKDIPGFDPLVHDREPEIIRSETFYFRYADVTSAGGKPEVISIAVTPEFQEAELNKDYEFQAVLELEGAGFADVNWRVVPSSAAILVSRGDYAYVTPLREGFISVIAEYGGESAYAVMRIGTGENPTGEKSEKIASLSQRLEKLKADIDAYIDLSSSATEKTAVLWENITDTLAITDQYIAQACKAYKLLEPLFLSGKASLSDPGISYWVATEVFDESYMSEDASDHGNLQRGVGPVYVADKSYLDNHIARNLSAFSDVQKELKSLWLAMKQKTDDLDSSLADDQEYQIALTSSRANINYGLHSIGSEVDNLLASLEVELDPF